MSLTDLMYMLEVMSGKVSTDELSEGALANGDVARNDGKITLEDGKRSIASTLKKLRTAVIGGSWLLLFSNPFWKFFRPW